MTATCVIGIQWGDEGKGKVVDLLAPRFDCVVRYQGGPNAGHTVVLDGVTYKLHQIPSGILHPRTECVIAHGVVVDMEVLVQEIDMLAERGVSVEGRLWVSDRCHLIMPWHRLLDAAWESSNGRRIGTTLRGIGPAYADKAARRGLRMGDLFRPSRFAERVADLAREQNRILRAVYGMRGVRAGEVVLRWRSLWRKIRPFVTDTVSRVNDALEAGRRVLFEGAQGSLLDIDFGTYPYVTSSNCDACGVSAGAGVPPARVGTILGVAKAYCTRVGEGPFPTEAHGPVGERLRENGREYGTTTGRPRRCGWFDAVSARFAVRVNGVTQVAITKLDVLSGFDEVRMAVAYRRGSERLTMMPSRPDLLEGARPEYRIFPGWRENLTGMRRRKDLPRNALRYLEAIELEIGAPVVLVSTGSERVHAIWMRR
jgi:adenylosuccinate synthase